MKYASTATHDGVERVVVVLPMSAVPGFDPQNPPQDNTYAVPDEVEVGWIKRRGGFVAPSAAGSAVPLSVARAQFMLALHAAGLLADVEAFVLASADPVLTINWRERPVFERDNPLVVAVAAALGKSSAEVDALFIAAKGM